MESLSSSLPRLRRTSYASATSGGKNPPVCRGGAFPLRPGVWGKKEGRKAASLQGLLDMTPFMYDNNYMFGEMALDPRNAINLHGVAWNQPADLSRDRK